MDGEVRAAAFNFLREQCTRHGEVLDRTTLQSGFGFRGARVPLVGPQGIFKPKVCDLPLSITTTPVIQGKRRPYDDQMDSNGVLAYRYRGTDPMHHENVWLRAAMQRRIPLVYFFGIVPGRYLPVWPVFIEGDRPEELQFLVRLDHAWGQVLGGPMSDESDPATRRYRVQLVQQRLHQQEFRTRVLRAYKEQCAICRLRHSELLEAAHILPDKEVRGEARVSNGLALCKLHHGAFDRYILGIRPDRVIELRRDILDEVDGPMLVHGLQGFEGKKVRIPRSKGLQPDEDLLAERYERFRSAG